MYYLQNIAASSGTGESDLVKLTQIVEAIPEVEFICLDVANGYSEHFVEHVKTVRSKFPSHTIMVSVCPPMTFVSDCLGKVVAEIRRDGGVW